MKKAYITAAVYNWETILVNGLPLHDPYGSIGFIKVYETLESLRKINPDSEYLIVEFPVTIKEN